MDLSGISSNYQSAKTDASAASSNALQNSLKNVSSDASEDELKGVIKDFEIKSAIIRKYGLSEEEAEKYLQ